jgi:hypothetical protein
MSIEWMKHIRLMRMVEGVVIYVCIGVGIVRYGNASRWRHMGREIGGTFPILFGPY